MRLLKLIFFLAFFSFALSFNSKGETKIFADDTISSYNSNSYDQNEYSQLQNQVDNTGIIIWGLFAFVVIAAGFFLFERLLSLKIKSIVNKLNISQAEISELIKLSKNNVTLHKGKLAELIINEAITAKKMKLEVQWTDIKKLALKSKDIKTTALKGPDIKQYLKNINIANTKNINLTPKELMDLYLTKDNVNLVFDIYVKLVDSEIQLPLSVLCDLQKAGINLQEFIFAVEFLRRYEKPLNFNELVPNYFQVVDLATLIVSYYELVKAGYSDLPFEDLQEHFLAKGNIKKVAEAIIVARRAKLKIGFEDIANLDLAGFDVVEEIQKAIKTQIVDVTVSAVSRDKFPVKVDVKVTFRTNLKELIGNPQQATVMARISEAIASAIGTVETHKELFENPNQISIIVMSKKVDQGTSLEIIAMSVVKMDIGKCLEVEVKQEKAKFERIIAEAESEKRKMYAEASTREARADIKRAEARIKRADAQIREAQAKKKEKEAGIEPESSENVESPESYEK